MSKAELVWRERTSWLACIASVWTCNASEITSRTALADPCISIIFVQGEDGSEVLLRGPETKPRIEVLVPGYTWTAIRLQPGSQLKGFPVEQLLNNSITLPTGKNGQFIFEGTALQFPDFGNAEQLIQKMQHLGLVREGVLDNVQNPRQGISSRSYSRLVKRTTGLSPYKLRQLQRIHEALYLLKQGKPAAEVASELGFVDQAHLNRAAKQFLGHTPKELLKMPQKP